MRSTNFSALFLGVASFAALAGCSSNGSSSGSGSGSNATPTSNDYDDVAQSTAALVGSSGSGGEVGSMEDSASLALGILPLDVTLSGQGTFNGSHAGLSYSFDLTCQDAQGTALPQCGPMTNEAKASVDWSGNLTLPNYAANVTRKGSWTLTGVQSSTTTFDGTGTFTFASQFQSSFRNEQSNISFDYAATYTGVSYDKGAHHAAAGTIHYVISATRAASSANGQSAVKLAIDASLVFSADGSATLTLDGTHKYLVSVTGSVKAI